MRSVLADLFELVELQVPSLNLFPQLSLALLKSINLGFGGFLG